MMEIIERVYFSTLPPNDKTTIHWSPRQIKPFDGDFVVEVICKLPFEKHGSCTVGVKHDLWFVLVHITHEAPFHESPDSQTGHATCILDGRVPRRGHGKEGRVIRKSSVSDGRTAWCPMRWEDDRLQVCHIGFHERPRAAVSWLIWSGLEAYITLNKASARRSLVPLTDLEMFWLPLRL